MVLVVFVCLFVILSFVLYVCLSVCLSVSNIILLKLLWTGCDEILCIRRGWGGKRNMWINIVDTPDHHDDCPTRKSGHYSVNYERILTLQKGMNGLPWIWGGTRDGKRNKWLNSDDNLDHHTDCPIGNPAITHQSMSGFWSNVQDSSAMT